MESMTYHKTDPSILLQNEIEILLAQIHLMELYIKQARATAASEAARDREEQQAELLSLRSELERQELELKEYRAAAKEVDQTLSEQLQALRARLENNEQLLHNRDHELQETRSEIRSLRESMAHAESEIRNRDAAADQAERLRQGLQSELASLQGELEEKKAELLRFQAATREHEDDWKGQLLQLQASLTEKQSSLQAKEVELEQAVAEIARLAQRVSDLESNVAAARAAATLELELNRGKFQTDLDALHAQLRSKEETLRDREGAIAALDAQLKGQIDDLRRELCQNTELLGRRQHELQDFQSQTAALRERIATLEAQNEQAVAAVTELESIREGAATELAQLREELQQKALLLAEREERFAAAEHSLQEEIQNLHRRLLERQGWLESKDRELEHAHSEAAALRTEISRLETDLRDVEWTASSRAERVCEQLRSEVVELRAALNVKEGLLQEREAVFGSVESNFNIAIDRLRTELTESQRLLDRGCTDLEQARSEIAALRQQNSELELLSKQTEKLLSVQGEQIRQRVRNEIGALETQLHERDASLLAARREIDDLRGESETKVSELQSQLAGKQLLNDSRAAEIDDLKSQVNRLLEQSAQEKTSRQQTEAALTGEIAQLRESQEAEVVTLREELRRNRVDHEERVGSFRISADKLGLELSDLRAQLKEKESLISGRERDLETTRGELAALHKRLASLESSHQREKETTAREADRLQAVFAAELAAKDRAIEERQTVVESLERQYSREVNGLHNQLTDLQRLLEIRDAELEEASGKENQLRRRMVQLEAADDEMGQAKGQTQAALATVQAELARRTAALREQELIAKQRENTLQEQLAALRTEAREKHELLESRNEELVRVKAELDLLHERLTEMEFNAKRTEENAATESERMRTEFQAHIAYLQAELSQKDWALAEKQAAARGLERAQPMQHEESPIQASKAQEPFEKRDKAFVMGEPTITEVQVERSGARRNQAETARPEDEQRFATARQRRWQMGLGWKRRWKT